MDKPAEKILNGEGDRRLGRASGRSAERTRGPVLTLQKIWYDSWGLFVVGEFLKFTGRPNSG